MSNFAFWSMIVGFAFIACLFFFVIMKIIDRKRNWLRCGICDWEGDVPDQFDCCPNCGFYNWTYYNEKDEDDGQ